MSINESFNKKQFRNEYHRALGNIQFTASYLTNALQAKLEKFNLTVQQFHVLKILQNSGEPCLSITEIKEHMVDRNSDMTRLADRLVEKNLLTREPDVENRRKINLCLTEEARELISSLDAEIKEVESLIYHMSQEEIETLNRLLIKLRERF